MAGRIHPGPSIGSLDGALAELRLGSLLGIGAFAGRTAEPGVGAAGPKLGGYLRAAPRARSALGEAILAYVRESLGGQLERETFSAGARVSAGAVSADGRIDVERESSLISTLALHLRWRASESTTRRSASTATRNR